MAGSVTFANLAQNSHWKSPNSIRVTGAVGFPMIVEPCFMRLIIERLSGVVAVVLLEEE
jgi:hypothetical protein